MKNLKDFNIEKVAVDSIYGGKMAANTFDSDTTTAILGGGGTSNDGSDEEWDV